MIRNPDKPSRPAGRERDGQTKQQNHQAALLRELKILKLENEMLTEALLDIVRKYGLTDKARDAFKAADDLDAEAPDQPDE